MLINMDQDARIARGEVGDTPATTGVQAEPETCEDRDYKCCEQLSPEQHLERFGYVCASDEPYEPTTGVHTATDDEYEDGTTPKPWITGTVVRGLMHGQTIFCCAFDTAHPIKIATCGTPQDAAFIVRAVNSHAALVAAAQFAKHFVETFCVVEAGGVEEKALGLLDAALRAAAEGGE